MFRWWRAAPAPGFRAARFRTAAGVTVSLAKFNKILSVDPLSCTAVVQCGVRNLAISEAAAPYGLYYAPDPSSQIACTIGGNVAENSGGVHCLKYGLTLHNVLRVRGLTAAGEPVEFGSEALDAPGLDLLAIVIGSEGMLAVTTEVTVKLVPKPELARCMLASFATVEAAGDAVANVIARGIIPAGLELMDRRMTEVAENFVHAGYDLSAAAILLCESDGTPEEVEEEIAAMSRVLTESGATRIEVSRDEAQRLKFWSGRKNAFPASGGISPDYMCMDSTIPRRKLAEMLLAIEVMESEVRPALRERVPCGRRQPASADPVRCERSRSIQALRAVRRGDPGDEPEARRHRHRRARRRRGEAQLDVRAVLARGARSVSRRQARLRCRGAAQSRQGDSDAAALRGVRQDARASRHDAVPRPAEVLMSAMPAGVAQLIDRMRAARAAALRCKSWAAAPRPSTAKRRAASRSTLRELAGITSYEPSELVVTVRAGTPLAELESALAAKGQCLPFEPPRFAAGGTVGGMVAAGLAGPSRAAVGALRDYVLGLTLLDGRGELLTFGGQVMKNVAGYDVSRLIAGSWGVLGVICEVSLKVLAAPGRQRDAASSSGTSHALSRPWRAGVRSPCRCRRARGASGRLRIRLAGSRAAVLEARARLGGTAIDRDGGVRLIGRVSAISGTNSSRAAAEELGQGTALWRLSVPPTAAAVLVGGPSIHRMGRRAALVAHGGAGGGGARRGSERRGSCDAGARGRQERGRVRAAERRAHAHPSSAENRLRSRADSQSRAACMRTFDEQPCKPS